jgi:hypothetical protein
VERHRFSKPATGGQSGALALDGLDRPQLSVPRRHFAGSAAQTAASELRRARLISQLFSNTLALQSIFTLRRGMRQRLKKLKTKLTIKTVPPTSGLGCHFYYLNALKLNFPGTF